MERIETLSQPGAKERGKTHTCLRAFGRAGSSADFACDHQWANTALGQIVVCWNSRDGDKDKKFGQKAFDALTQRVLGGRTADKWLAQLPQTLLEGMLGYKPVPTVGDVEKTSDQERAQPKTQPHRREL